MNALFESVAWNSLAALALAILVLVAGRIWKRPELLHVLWLVVLVKLVTPGVIRFDALPDVRKTVPVAFAMQSTDALPLAELPAASPAGLEAGYLVRWSEASLAVWIGGSVLFLILVGAAIYIWAATAFVREGKGTPSPTAPPTQFVAVGPYRYVRNPIYIGELIVVAGLAAILGSALVLIYAGGLFAVLHMF
ncbi:MAG: hypothetical protein IH848_11125, partial [Acidobacteria bacterium]|nr:hypothetical protein [Acidobacteriota bacterium]